MLAPPHGVRVFVCTQATGMRKSFDGMIAAKKSVMGENPLPRHRFVFVSRQGNHAKALYWQRCTAWGAGQRVYLADAWLDLDTNDLERALRSILMGR